jgi:AcrR family transcriptional regulator
MEIILISVIFIIIKGGALMKKVEQNKKQKQERILKAAEEIFQSNGFIGTSMDNIAEKACVTKQTIYRYFDTKEALFLAALEAQRLRSNNDFLDALDRQEGEKALQTFAVGFIKRHLSREHLATVRLLVSEGSAVPEITRAFYAMGSGKVRMHLARFLKEQFEANDAEYEIDVFLNELLSMRMPVLTGLHALPSQATIRRHAEKTVALLMTLLESRGQAS